MDNKMYFNFSVNDAKKVFLLLITFEVFIVAIYALDMLHGIGWRLHVLFDLDGEGTVPAWFSSMQLFLIGLLFLMSGRNDEKQKIISRAFLYLIGFGFVFLSMDEGAGFHERVSTLLKHIEWLPRFEGNYGIWMSEYLLAGGVIGVVTYKQSIAFWKNYRRESIVIICGMTIILLGAAGLESVSYLYLRASSAGMNPKDSLGYRIEVTFEEFFEMLGASVILYGAMLFSIRQRGD
jgi:hypothetical protein